jgi:hypothetical protein
VTLVKDVGLEKMGLAEKTEDVLTPGVEDL